MLVHGLRPQDGAGVRRLRRAGAGRIVRRASAVLRKTADENAYSENAESYLAAKEEKFKEIAILNKANHKK